MQPPPYVIFPAYEDDSFNCKDDEMLLSFSVVQVSEVTSSNAIDIDSKMKVLTGTITIVLGHTFITENFTLLEEQKY